MLGIRIKSLGGGSSWISPGFGKIFLLLFPPSRPPELDWLQPGDPGSGNFGDSATREGNKVDINNCV